MKATALAHSNLALVKYWGKKNALLNIPAVGSISITLKELFTRTQVQFDPKLDSDVLILNTARSDQQKEKRIGAFFDIIRSQAKIDNFARVVSENNFPTGAGLASSASGFAALAIAGTKAAQLSLPRNRLSVLARRGSGSAARSILGGFVEMKVGEKSDGSDSFAIQLADENYWNLSIIVVITTEVEKPFGSSEGMKHTELTSPFYRDWVTSSKHDLSEMRNAINNKDFEKLGELSEYSCLKMHALMMSAKPGLLYWNQTTIAVIQILRELRQKNIQCYFTIDAGPQVKIICLPQDVEKVEKNLVQVTGIKKIIHTGLGPGAKLIETES